LGSYASVSVKREKQIPCGNDRQKSKNKCKRYDNSRSFATLRMTNPFIETTASQLDLFQQVAYNLVGVDYACHSALFINYRQGAEIVFVE
jgi:hypothetical protein